MAATTATIMWATIMVCRQGRWQTVPGVLHHALDPASATPPSTVQLCICA